MRIDAHSHGMHAERNEKGLLAQPLMPAWQRHDKDPQEYIEEHKRIGIEKVVILDPAEVAFELLEIFGDFILPCPMVELESLTPQKAEEFLQRGACGIKFIAPMSPYGDDRYLPIYEVLNRYHALAVFHTGFLAHNMFGPEFLMYRSDRVNILNMRPAELDRIARTFPKLKILASHFGNPWWEECWNLIKNNENIYADFSGGTALKKSMNLWRDMFMPNGILHEASVSKLCFGADMGFTYPGIVPNYQPYFDFHDKLFDELKLSEELREKINRGNILMLTNKECR